MGSRLALFFFAACAAAWAGAPGCAHAQLYITELMAINDSTIADEDGEFSDWLEIHNAGLVAANVGGWYLTDDDSDLARWQLPAEVIGPGGYLLVFASSKDRAVAGSELHTSFKLSGAGEYLALVRGDGSTIEHEYAPEFPEQSSDVSHGLAADLVTERCFVDPTPEAVNDESSGCGVIEELVFSVERGFYDSAFSVTISTATPGAAIYYTLDGSEPTEAAGTPYGGAIPVSTITTLRAAAIAAGFQPGPSMTHTYIFAADVLAQSGAGLPQTWAADYEMDPEVVNDPAYAGSLVDDLLAIPTLSVVMDLDDLFGDSNGIYSHPSQTGIEWERPASAELIFADGADGFQANCGTRIQGDLSRSSNRKKSFRLAFKSIYGPSKLDYPLFGPGVTSFDKVRLRASSEKSWSFGSKRATYVRDQWVRDTQLEMGRTASRGTFVHLYLNGLYWGLYNAVEKPDESFAAAHLGGSEDDWDVIKHPFDVVNGDRVAWDTARDIAIAGVQSSAAYAAIQQYIDVPNLIDYFIANLYAGTTDWDGNNWYAARRRQSGAGFKFFSWDAEQSMVSLKSKRTGIANDNRPSTFYNALRRDNAEFRVLFGDHLHRHFFNDGVLTPARASQRFVARTDEIDRAIVGESARWGDTVKGIPLTRDDEWLVEAEWLRLAYYPSRSAIVLGQFRDIDLYPSTEAPTFGQHGGFVPAGFQLEITAPAGTIYYTVDGADPRQAGGAVAPGALVYTGPIALGDHATVRARASVGSGWSALVEAEFSVDIPLRVSELMFHPADPVPPGGVPDDDFEFVEIVNVGTSTVLLGGVAFTDGVDFVFSASSLAAGDSVLLVSNQTAFESRYGAGLPVAGEYSGRFSNSGETVRLEAADGREILEFTFADKWYATTDGDGRSLVARDVLGPRSAWSSAAGWRASTFDEGSPGAAELPLCSDGVDNDGDGDIDAGSDAGCLDGLQNIEDPECDDGLDNDGDGDVDTLDGECDGAWDDQEAAEPVDTFVCYQARRSNAGPDFDDVDVTLDDEFDGAGVYTVRDPRGICVPASIDAGAITDPATHLTSYQIREASGTPRHGGRTGELVTGLGPTFLDTSKVDRLLVPAAMDLDSAVAAPVPGTHNVDHYKCYKAKTTKGRPKYFPKGVQLDAAETVEDRRYDLVRPVSYCNPVDKNGEGVINPVGKLVCYKAKRAKTETKHVRRAGVSVADQLWAGLLDTRKVESFCVAAR